MKLLTINTHSIIEQGYEDKLDVFTDAIARIRPDIIAMQEVNQSSSSPIATLGNGYPLRCDNHALRVSEKLYDKGIRYRYVWQGIKECYSIYEEGVALMTRLPISDTESFLISRTNDIKNWKTRMALGIRVGESWFYSIHTGRNDDADDPFCEQWERFLYRTRDKDKVYAMGDFNCPQNGDGYKTVIDSGWYDTYCEAKHKDNGITVPSAIDGWRDAKSESMRIDYIFANKKINVERSEVLFNGENEKVVSDHFGVLVTV